MPQGDKSAYTDKQKRKAEHIEESYEKRGAPEKDAERIAWATVNKDDGGGKKSGSGRGAETGHPAAHKGRQARRRSFGGAPCSGALGFGQGGGYDAQAQRAARQLVSEHRRLYRVQSPEQVPKKLTDFFDQNLLQLIDLARFLIDQTIPSDRKAR